MAVGMIKLLRLKGGEDIVGDIIGENSEYFIIKNPAMLMPVGDPRGGNVQMGLAPWLPFSDQKNIDIPRDWILITAEAIQDIVNNYNQIFGSGIVVPQVGVNQKTLLQE